MVNGELAKKLQGSPHEESNRRTLTHSLAGLMQELAQFIQHGGERAAWNRGKAYSISGESRQRQNSCSLAEVSQAELSLTTAYHTTYARAPVVPGALTVNTTNHPILGVRSISGCTEERERAKGGRGAECGCCAPETWASQGTKLDSGGMEVGVLIACVFGQISTASLFACAASSVSANKQGHLCASWSPPQRSGKWLLTWIL